MTEETLAIYGKDFTKQDLKAFMKDSFPDFSNGYAILELFGRNIFVVYNSLSNMGDLVDDMISARFFDAQKQLKCRRITDGIFRVAADFQIDGWEGKPISVYTEKERHIALWGYHNPGMEGLYEERIPYVFSYPSAEVESLEERERMEITAVEFHDQFGRPLWIRFTGLKKWEVAQNGERGKEEKMAQGVLDHGTVHGRSEEQKASEQKGTARAK